jgi:ArsR family transcriptional regulator
MIASEESTIAFYGWAASSPLRAHASFKESSLDLAAVASISLKESPENARSKPMARYAARSRPGPVLERLAETFRTLADCNRLMILKLLATEGEMSVGTISERIRQSQPTVSHHLAMLRAMQLVRCRRDGKFNLYRLHEAGLASAFEELGWPAGQPVPFGSFTFTWQVASA